MELLYNKSLYQALDIGVLYAVVTLTGLVMDFAQAIVIVDVAAVADFGQVRHGLGHDIAHSVVGVAGAGAVAVGLRGDVAVLVVPHVFQQRVASVVLFRDHADELAGGIVAVGQHLAIGVLHLADAVPTVVLEVLFYSTAFFQNRTIPYLFLYVFRYAIL